MGWDQRLVVHDLRALRRSRGASQAAALGGEAAKPMRRYSCGVCEGGRIQGTAVDAARGVAVVAVEDEACVFDVRSDAGGGGRGPAPPLLRLASDPPSGGDARSVLSAVVHAEEGAVLLTSSEGGEIVARRFGSRLAAIA